jgi:hypothetical protein
MNNNNERGDKLWRHFFKIKTDVKKYSAGVLTQDEVEHSNLRQIHELLMETRPGGPRSSLLSPKTTQDAASSSEISDRPAVGEETLEETLGDAYPVTTFFLAKVRHQLVYMEPNTAIYRVWNPSIRKDGILREGERRSIYTSGAADEVGTSGVGGVDGGREGAGGGGRPSAATALDSKKPHRVSSRRIISSMLISHLDAPGKKCSLVLDDIIFIYMLRH